MNPTKTLTQECNCPAYPEPHVAGLCNCHVEDVARPICESCGNNCESTVVDDGIGPYEYWGQKGFHEDKWEGSDCCEGPIKHPHALDQRHRGTVGPSIDQVLPKLCETVREDMPEDYLELAKAHYIPYSALHTGTSVYWSSPECCSLYARCLELLCGYDLEELLND